MDILNKIQQAVQGMKMNFQNTPSNPQAWRNPNPVFKNPVQNIQQGLQAFGAQNPRVSNAIVSAPQYIPQPVKNAFSFVGRQPITINNPVPFQKPIQLGTVGGLTKGYVQGLGQFGAGLANTMNKQSSFTPNDWVTQSLMGNQPVKDIRGQGADFSKGAQAIGIPKGLADKAGVPFVVGLGLTNLIGGGGKNVVGKEAINLATKAKTVEEFVSLLSKSKPKVKAFVSSILKDTKNPINTVEDFFNQAKGVKPNVPRDANAGFYDTGKTFYRGEGGSDVAQGKALLAEGKHFSMDSEYPKRFGEVKEYVAKKGAKVFDAGDETFTETLKKLGLPHGSGLDYISPQNLSKVLKEKGYDIIQYNGTYQSTGKPFTHIVELTDNALIPKSRVAVKPESGIIPTSQIDMLANRKVTPSSAAKSSGSIRVAQPTTPNAGLYDTKPLKDLPKWVKKEWYHGSDARQKSGDIFASNDISTAGEYGKARKLTPDELPKNPLIVSGSKENFESAVGYKRYSPDDSPLAELARRPKEETYDVLIKKYAQDKGHDGIIYTSGTFEQPELVIFGGKSRVAQPTTPPAGFYDTKPLNQQAIKTQGELVPALEVSPSSPGIIAHDVKKVLTGQSGVKERGFITTVKESSKTPQAVKDIISGSYVPKSGVQLRTDTKALLKADPVMAEELAINPKTDIHVQLGNELMAHYAATGQTAKAKALGERMAESGTELGKAVQAFANYDKTTPTGALRMAQSAVNAYNKTASKPLRLTDAQVESLFRRATGVQKMPIGRERNIAANDLTNEINNLIPSGFWDKTITVWKAGLLTSLRTHERNIIGNAIHQGAEILKDPFATLADKALSLKTGQRTVTSTLQGIGSGAKVGAQAAKDIVNKGYDAEQAIAKYDVKHVTWGNSKLEQGLKIYTQAVFRTLGAADKPFWNAAYARSLYDQAGALAINAGKQGDKTFIEKLVKSPTPEMLGEATKDANVSTFKNPTAISEVAKNIQGVKIGGVPVGQVVAPFTGVPSSIAGQMVAYSPIGLVKGMITAGKVIAKDIPSLQRQASQEIGRGVVGTGLFGIGAYLASKGLMTGQPKDAQESAQWQLEGKQANSVLVGGEWRSIGSIGPENLVILAGAKANQELSNPDASLGSYGAKLGKDFLSQTFLQGVQGPLNAITDPNRYGPSYFGNQSASLVPNIIKDTSKAFDPYQRENNQFSDYIGNSIPGIRNKNIVKRDNLGNPMKQEPTGIGAYIDLFNSKTPINNAIVDELKRLNDAGSNATPSKINKSQTINKVKVTLTPKQLDLFEAKVGRMAQDMLPRMFESQGYQNLTDEQKVKAIDGLMTKIKAVFKKTDLGPGAPKYESNPEDPKNLQDKVGLAIKGVLAGDSSNVIKAIFTEEELRKIRGDAVIFKRKLNLNTTKDTSDAVDHTVSLGLGGDNSDGNLKYIDKNIKARKDALEYKLIDELSRGIINKNEAQRQLAEFVKQNPMGRAYSEVQGDTSQSSSVGGSIEQSVAQGIKSAQTPQQKQNVWDYYVKQGYITNSNLSQIRLLLAK